MSRALANAPEIRLKWLSERGAGYQRCMHTESSAPDERYLRANLLKRCLRWTRGDLPEAEDLLADAWLRVVEVSTEHEGIAKPMSYWATVINNLGRDRLRRAQRWRVQGGEPARAIFERLPAVAPSGEHLLWLKERLNSTARHLDGLNHKQRMAILLRSEGNDYSTIAQALQTSEVNARKLVETARHALLALLTSRRSQTGRRSAA